MAWEIRGLHGTAPRATMSGTRGTTAEAGSAPDGSFKPGRIDQIIFTDAAVSLQRLDGLLRELPVEDTARVGVLREQIADGLYRIDDYRTADKLAAFEFRYHQAIANDGFQTSA